MGKPQAQGKGRGVCYEGIAYCPALFLLLAADLLDKRSIGNRFNGKDQNLKQDIAEGKGQCARVVIDDINYEKQMDYNKNGMSAGNVLIVNNQKVYLFDDLNEI